MAVFLSDRPFSGVKQMKYEQLRETNPEWLKEVPKQELEDYLKKLEARYLERLGELQPVYEQKLGVDHELRRDFAESYRRIEQAQQMAREQALRELMEA